jgi:pyrroline-5-carboxylate reductase
LAAVANRDISTIRATSRGGGKAASLRQAVTIVFESACSSEITAGCNVNISSGGSPLGVDTGYFDVVAGLEGDLPTFFFVRVGVYEACLNTA